MRAEEPAEGRRAGPADVLVSEAGTVGRRARHREGGEGVEVRDRVEVVVREPADVTFEHLQGALSVAGDREEDQVLRDHVDVVDVAACESVARHVQLLGIDETAGLEQRQQRVRQRPLRFVGEPDDLVQHLLDDGRPASRSQVASGTGPPRNERTPRRAVVVARGASPAAPEVASGILESGLPASASANRGLTTPD